MFFSLQISTMLLPPSAARKMRILSSVGCLLPFKAWSFVLAQTNTQGGSNFRGQVTPVELVHHAEIEVGRRQTALGSLLVKPERFHEILSHPCPLA